MNACRRTRAGASGTATKTASRFGRLRQDITAPPPPPRSLCRPHPARDPLRCRAHAPSAARRPPRPLPPPRRTRLWLRSRPPTRMRLPHPPAYRLRERAPVRAPHLSHSTTPITSELKNFSILAPLAGCPIARTTRLARTDDVIAQQVANGIRAHRRLVRCPAVGLNGHGPEDGGMGGVGRTGSRGSTPPRLSRR